MHIDSHELIFNSIIEFQLEDAKHIISFLLQLEKSRKNIVY